MKKFNILVGLVLVGLLVLINVNIGEIKEDINVTKDDLNATNEIEVYMDELHCPECNKKEVYKYIYTQRENGINFVINTVFTCDNCDKDIEL